MANHLSAVRAWHRRWFWPLNAVGLLLILTWCWFSHMAPMARLRASGAPTTLAELVATPIPDDENAAAALRDAGDALDRFGSSLGAFYNTQAGVAYGAMEPLEPLRGDTLKAVRELLDENGAAVLAFQEIASRSNYSSLLSPDGMSIEGLLDGDLARARSVARVADLLQRVQLADNDRAASAETAIATIRLGKQTEAEPFIINRLLAVALQTIGLNQAERSISSGDIDASRGADLDAAMASIALRDSMTFTLESERVLSLSLLEEMPFPVALWERDGVLEGFGSAVELASRPLEQIEATVRQPMANKGGLGSLLHSPFVTYFEAEIRVAKKARQLRERLSVDQ